MIVIGVDGHKHSLTAVDEAGRQIDELTLECPEAPLFAWAASLGQVRLWALEDCRHVTGRSNGSSLLRVRSSCGSRRS